MRKSSFKSDYRPKLIKLILCLNRVLLITFGGCVYNHRENALSVSKKLKFFGYFSIALATLVNVIFYLNENVTPCSNDTDGFNDLQTIGSIVWDFLTFIYCLIITLTLQLKGSVFLHFIHNHFIDRKTFMIIILQFSFNAIDIIVSFILYTERCSTFLPIAVNLTMEAAMSILFQTAYLYIFVTIIIALQNLKLLQKQLSQSLQNIEEIKRIRSKFVKLRNDVNKVNSSCALLTISTFAYYIYSIMIPIYLAVSVKDGTLSEFVLLFAYAFFLAIKLIIICILSGKLHEELKRFVSVFDSIDIKEKNYEMEIRHFTSIVQRQSIVLQWPASC